MHQGIKYAGVGLFNTALSTLIMLGLAGLGLHYALYTAIGYLAGFVSSFLLNRRVTFRSGHAGASLWWRFVAVNAGLLILVQLLQHFVISGQGLPEWFGVGVGLVTYTGLGFFINRRLFAQGYVIRPSRKERESQLNGGSLPVETKPNPEVP